jgi:hypothetical protein
MDITTWAENGNEAEEFTGMEFNKPEAVEQSELDSICSLVEKISPKDRHGMVKYLTIERDGLEKKLIKYNTALERLTKLTNK